MNDIRFLRIRAVATLDGVRAEIVIFENYILKSTFKT